MDGMQGQVPGRGCRWGKDDVGYSEEASGGIVLGIITYKTSPSKSCDLSRFTKFKSMNPDFYISSCW